MIKQIHSAQSSYNNLTGYLEVYTFRRQLLRQTPMFLITLRNDGNLGYELIDQPFLSYS